MLALCSKPQTESGQIRGQATKARRLGEDAMRLFFSHLRSSLEKPVRPDLTSKGCWMRDVSEQKDNSD